MRFSAQVTSVGLTVFLASTGMLACSSSSSDGSGGKGGTGGHADVDSGPVGAQASDDWTMLGYDLASTYWNKAETKISTTTAPNLAKAWEFDTKGSVTSTPVISGGRVYVATSVGVIAIDLASGQELWRNEHMAGSTSAAPDLSGSSSLALDNGVLYMDDSLGVVHALDVNDKGHEKWSYKPPESWVIGFSSPVVTKDYVLLGTSGLEEVSRSADLKAGKPADTRGYIFALNKSDGTLAWRKDNSDPPSAGVAIWSTLSVDEEAGVVIAGTGNTYSGPPADTADAFLAVPLKDGSTHLWHPQILTNDVYPGGDGPDGDFGANPILFEVNGRKLAAGGAKMGDVFVVDRADGSIVKQRNLGPGTSYEGGIFVNGAWDGQSLLFACNGATSTGPGSEGSAGALFALDPLTLDVKWEREIGGTVWGPISVANGVGFFGKNTTLQAFDTATGAVLLEFPTEASIATAPAVSDGYVVFGSGMSWIAGISTAGTKYYALKVP